MDELLRSRRLAEQILARAQAIEVQQEAIRSSLLKMQLLEQGPRGSAAKSANSPPSRSLMDLPDDCLTGVLSYLDSCGDLCTLAQVCSRWRRIVYHDTQGWERRCRADWGIAEPFPELVACLQHGILEALPNQDHRSSGGGGPAPWHGATLSSTPGLTAVSDGGGGSRGGSAGEGVELPEEALITVLLHSPGNRRGGGSRPGGQLGSPRLHSLRDERGSTGSMGFARATHAAVLSVGLCSPGRPGSAAGRRAVSDSGQAQSGRGSEDGAHRVVNPTPWRGIYQDRVQGWRVVDDTLRWLRDHGSPASVTGSVHRLQLLLALRYMALGTAHARDMRRRIRVLGQEGVRSLVALLGNTSLQVVELATQILGNLITDDPSTKVMLMIASRMGKVFSDRLDGASGSRLQGLAVETCRLLVNLWAQGDMPEVRCLTPTNAPARPRLLPGVWQLQEFTLRGEAMQLLHLLLSFEPDAWRGSQVHVTGCGIDESGGTTEQFDVKGTVDVDSRAWSFTRVYPRGAHTIFYSGFSDADGCFGLYTTQRPDGQAAPLLISSSRQPRVYRLYRSASKAGTDDGTAGLS